MPIIKGYLEFLMMRGSE